MSTHDCEHCKGTGLICPSCSFPRQYGAPHRQCRPHKRCTNHTKSFYRCDCCREVMEYESFAFGHDYLHLCPACEAIAVQQMRKAKAVIIDLILELRTSGTPPASLVEG